MEKIYLIIVGYNPDPWIDKVIETFEREPFHEMVWVDNGSIGIENLEKKLLACQKPVTFLPQNENLGFGAANNIGIRYALEQYADFFLLLNQDVWLEPGTLSNLIAISKVNPEFGILSPLHLNGLGNGLDKGFANYISPPQNYNLLNDLLLHKKLKNIVYEVPFVNAACWLLTRKCINLVGGFSPLFFHYHEDSNFCHRVHFHGLKVGIVPNLLAYHDRDSRPELKSDVSAEEFLFRLRRQLALQWSNPFNTNWQRDAHKFINLHKRNYLKSLIKGNFGILKMQRKTILLATQLEKDVAFCRKEQEKELAFL